MPAIKAEALTAAGIRSLTTPGDYSDGNGLTLSLDGRGNKRWFQRITVNGRLRKSHIRGRSSCAFLLLRAARPAGRSHR